MPYKERGPFHVAMREWLRELRPSEATSDIGVITKDTYQEYRAIVLDAGKRLGYPNPRHIKLAELRVLETKLSGGERTVALRASVFRQFLKHAGCKDALRWKLKARQTGTCKTRVWLNEHQIALARRSSKEMGVLTELLYSLAVDMGLRAIDCQRLTYRNAEEFLLYGRSMIRGKGRNGGKIAEQLFSEMTREPLMRYLDQRTALCLKMGKSPDTLLIREVEQGKRHELKPLEYEGNISNPTKELSARCGFGFHFHDLRATFGNRLYRKKVPIETIAKLMRHDNPNTTFKVYIGVDQDAMRGAMDSLCPNPCPSSPSQQNSVSENAFSRASELARPVGASSLNSLS